MTDELESKLWYQELKDKVDNNILAYQDKRDYFWDKVNPEHLRYFKTTVVVILYKPLSIRVDGNIQSKPRP